MKFTIPLKDFFKYTGIDYKEDAYDCIFHDYIKYSIDDILYNLPEKYSFTDEQIKENDALYDALNTAMNRANESGLIDAACHKQIKAVESFADNLVDYINQIEANALNTIHIDWANEKVTIDYNRKECASAIVQIIDGEGMFQYGTLKAFFECCGKDAIQSHPHYLLNVKLINDIWGMTGKPRFEWDVRSWDIDKDYLVDCIDEELAEIVPTATKRIEKIQKDLQSLTLLTQ